MNPLAKRSKKIYFIILILTADIINSAISMTNTNTSSATAESFQNVILESRLPANDEIDIYLSLPIEIEREAQRIHKQIHTELKSLPVIKTIYHITLFQGLILPEDQPTFFQELSTLIGQIHCFKVEMAQSIVMTEKNIQWEAVIPNPSLQKLHEKILLLSQKYRSGQIRAHRSQNNTKEVEQWGMRGTFQNYNPHITLFYESGNQANTFIAKINPLTTTFIANRVGAGQIGYVGNLLKPLITFDLKFDKISSC
jgi:2'-5' RNA ligase